MSRREQKTEGERGRGRESNWNRKKETCRPRWHAAFQKGYQLMASPQYRPGPWHIDHHISAPCLSIGPGNRDAPLLLSQASVPLHQMSHPPLPWPSDLGAAAGCRKKACNQMQSRAHTSKAEGCQKGWDGCVNRITGCNELIWLPHCSGCHPV